MYACAYFVLYMYVLKHIMDRIYTQYVHKYIQYANGGSIWSILGSAITYNNNNWSYIGTVHTNMDQILTLSE